MGFHGDYSDDNGNGNSLINGCVWGTCLCACGPMVIVKISARFPYISLKSTQVYRLTNKVTLLHKREVVVQPL